MLKILVIGETCVDKFIYCNTERLSPEAPVPVLLPLKYIESPGMSGNVVRNISALNAKAKITHYHQDRIITKTRYVEEKSNHMFFRVDENEYGPYDQFKFSDIKDEDFDIVIVSDYDKGYLSNRDILSNAPTNVKLNF
jgi:D-beta-D-heptose 7-phosphate kinase/D-beta-D-heptose 1-phosphate adenosyltransferase